jgi:probable HAF family extracellular repeat protein
MIHRHLTLAVLMAAILGLAAGVMISARPAGSPSASMAASMAASAAGSASPSSSASATPSAPPLTQRYTYTDLGVIGGLDSMAFGVASGGIGDFSAAFVVGHADTAPNSKWTGFRAFQWVDSAGRMFDIGTLPGDLKSQGNAVNASGLIVGESLAGDTTRAFAYDGSMHALAGLGGSYAGARAVNDSGQIAGYAKTRPGPEHAVLWNRAANGTWTLSDIGLLPGDLTGGAQGMNARGQVVGYSNDSDYLSHAFLWTPTSPNASSGSMTALGALPGEEYASAYGINASGVVVGEAQIGTDAHAFMWTPSRPNGAVGVMKDIGTLGGSWSRANAINSAGDVVGVAEAAGPDHFDFAFLYRNGTMYDLNGVLPSDVQGVALTVAYGITDSGQIVGGATVGSHSHAFLLTPVSDD